MEGSTTVTIPLLNPNEREVSIAALHVSERQKVKKGDLICTIETTKSVADIEAERDGYILNLSFREGDFANAGDVLCYLADTPTWKPPVLDDESMLSSNASQLYSGSEIEIPNGLRISKPALALAQEHDLNLESLPTSEMITKERLFRIINQIETNKPQSKVRKIKEDQIPQKEYNPNALIVYGGGGHGKAVIELIRALNIYEIAGILDDGIDAETEIMGIPVFGGEEVLSVVFNRGIRLAVNAVGGIGDIKIRSIVFKKLLENGFECPTVIHPKAFFEPSSEIYSGVQIFPHAYIGSETKINFGAIINTGAIISHDCILDDHVNISPGAILAGMVHVEQSVLIGMGVTVNLGVNIGEGARIGNGATIKGDVPQKTIIRAGSIWPD